MTNLSTKLSDALKRQQQAEETLAAAREETEKLKAELAGLKAVALVKKFNDLANDFAKGTVQKILGKENAYGLAEDRPTIDFYGHLLDVALKPDTSLLKFLARVAQKEKGPGNTFSET
jgi:glutamyl-tRNA reductase